MRCGVKATHLRWLRWNGNAIVHLSNKYLPFILNLTQLYATVRINRIESLTKTLIMRMAVVAVCVSIRIAAHALTFKKG